MTATVMFSTTFIAESPTLPLPAEEVPPVAEGLAAASAFLASSTAASFFVLAASHAVTSGARSVAAALATAVYFPAVVRPSAARQPMV
jgi:hypothetical protein